jgi:aminoglycoside phosphotransferase (APT) family kinase protein
MPTPEISLKQAHAILERHHLGISGFAKMNSTGMANTIYALGEDLILRVPGDHPSAVAQTLTESVAVPVARQLQIQTPELLVFDDSLEILDCPFTIYERVFGDTLGLLDLEPIQIPETYRAVGRELAKLHAGVHKVDDPFGRLDQPGYEQPRATLEQLATNGFVSASDARWLNAWCDLLEPATLEPVKHQFLHNDIHEMNLMVKPDDHSFLAIIDWGNAGWGDPATEFRIANIQALPYMLEGYRSVMPLEREETIEARILWDQLGLALRRMNLELEFGVVKHGFQPFNGLMQLWRFTHQQQNSSWTQWFPVFKASS